MQRDAVRPTNRRRGYLITTLAMVATIGLAACGSSDPYELGATTPVEGQISNRGKALSLTDATFGRVWFHPDPAKGNRCPQTPVADLDSEGKYKLTTRGKLGAPAGWYKVTVIATEQIDPSQPKKKRKSLVPARYGAVTTTTLAVEVTERATPGAYDLDLR